ncbi:MAG: endonuclease/exonuclease/phosphatase family protein [Saprospiraceae bacterium]|nr:endonuclease/exonuclease/phosphatase family protein [Saprospiraceae bacterium]
MNIYCLRFFISLFISLVFQLWSNGQYFIDEQYNDWETNTSFILDAGDGAATGLDIQKLWMGHDAEHVYLRIDLDREIKFQEENKLVIYIDFDYNAATGFQTNGIGAELSLYAGDRDIYYHTSPTSSFRIRHDSFGILALPSVSSSTFEISLQRAGLIGGIMRSMGPVISVSVQHGVTEGDKLPNQAGGFTYALNQNTPASSKPYSFQKKQQDQVRVMSYNVARDGLTDPVTGPLQQKLIQAANPDVICFQEIYNANASEIVGIMNAILPLPGGRSWQATKVNPDIITVTKYCIEATQSINGNGVSLIYTGNACDKAMVIFNLHLPCCANDTDRQAEVDAVMAKLRRMKQNNGDGFLYPPGTPTLILGDMNLVGFNRQRTTLITGDIDNEGSYGPDFNPDWDGTDLEDALPFVPGMPLTYTWYDEGNDFLPGRLDYMFFTGNKMRIENAFVLETFGMDLETLQDFNFHITDAREASDHLPLVVDFTLGATNPRSLSANVIVEQGILCFGDKAILKIKGSDGFPPYSFSVNGNSFQQDSIFSSLGPGTYTFRVRDSRGDIFHTGFIEVRSPLPLSAMVNVSDEVISVAVEGGVPPYTYRLDDNNFAPLVQTIVVDENRVYHLTIKDKNGCLWDTEFSVFIDKDNDGYNSHDDCDDNNDHVYPGAAEIPGNGIDEDCMAGDLAVFFARVIWLQKMNCFGQKATLKISASNGVKPYQFSLDGFTYVTDSVFTNLGPGIYSPKAMDATGQIFDTGLLSVVEPPKLDAAVFASDDTIHMVVTGGTPPYFL